MQNKTFILSYMEKCNKVKNKKKEIRTTKTKINITENPIKFNEQSN